MILFQHLPAGKQAYKHKKIIENMNRNLHKVDICNNIVKHCQTERFNDNDNLLF